LVVRGDEVESGLVIDAIDERGDFVERVLSRRIAAKASGSRSSTTV